MKSALRFVIPYFIVYFAVTITINIVLGPPSMSEEYLATYGDDHERYVTISKMPEYKLYEERPALHPPDAAHAAAFAFADEYQTREAYHAEMHRRERYANILDFFKTGMVILLIVWFARKPLMGFLDNQIQLVRDQLDKAARDHQAAKARRAAAERQIAGLQAEAERMRAEAKARAAVEQAQIEAGTEQALALLAQEEADRVRNEELIAQRRIKRTLIDEAIRIVTEQYAASRTAEREAALVAQFAAQMEQTR